MSNGARREREIGGGKAVHQIGLETVRRETGEAGGEGGEKILYLRLMEEGGMKEERIRWLGRAGRKTEEGESGVKIRKDLLGGAFTNAHNCIHTHTHTHTHRV